MPMHFSECILKTKTWISDLYLISKSIKWYRCESNRPIFKWSHLKSIKWYHCESNRPIFKWSHLKSIIFRVQIGFNYLTLRVFSYFRALQSTGLQVNYSTVNCSTVQYCTFILAVHSTVQFIVVKCSTVNCTGRLKSKLQYSLFQYSRVMYWYICSTVQQIVVKRSSVLARAVLYSLLL